MFRFDDPSIALERDKAIITVRSVTATEYDKQCFIFMYLFVKRVLSGQTSPDKNKMASSAANSAMDVLRNKYYRNLNEMAVNKTPKVLMTRKWVDTMVEKILSAKKSAERNGVASLSSAVKYMLLDYDVIATPLGLRLVEKPKNAKEPDKTVVPLEETFELVQQAHILTNHGGCTAMNKWIADSKHTVSFICTPVGISTCRQCLLGPEEEEEKEEVRTERNPAKSLNVLSGLIDVIDMTLLPDNNFKYLLIYQDVRTKFTQLRPITGDDIVEELTMELIKIFSDFQPVKRIYMQENLKNVSDAVLDRLNQVFPEILLSYYAPSECRIALEVDLRLRDWMTRTSSTSWALGCYFIQWAKNSLDNFDGSPFENFLGHILAKNDPVNYGVYDIETPSTSKEITPEVRDRRIRDEMEDSSKANHQDYGDYEILSSAFENTNKTIIYKETVRVKDVTDVVEVPLNIENPLNFIEDTALPKDKTFGSRVKHKTNIEILENKIVSVPYSAPSHINSTNFYQETDPLIDVTDHVVEDPLIIDGHTESPNENTLTSVEEALVNNINSEPKVKILENRVVSIPFSQKGSTMACSETGSPKDFSDDSDGQTFSIETSSSSNESLKSIEKTVEDSRKYKQPARKVVSDLYSPPVYKNTTVIIKETSPALDLTDNEVKDPLNVESPSSKIANAIQSLERKLLKIRKPKPKVRNKIESVVYHETREDAELKPKRAKTRTPQKNIDSSDTKVAEIIKKQIETTPQVPENVKRRAATTISVAEIIAQVAASNMKRTEITEEIIANELKIINKQATACESVAELIAQVTESPDKQTEMETNVEDITKKQEANDKEAEISTVRTETPTVAETTAKVIETVTNLTETTANVVETVTNVTETTANTVETVTNVETTANVVETVAKVAETSKIALTEHQNENIIEIKSYTCCTCKSFIIDDLVICCVCKKSLHLYCGAMALKDGVAKSICFTCIL